MEFVKRHWRWAVPLALLYVVLPYILMKTSIGEIVIIPNSAMTLNEMLYFYWDLIFLFIGSLFLVREELQAGRDNIRIRANQEKMLEDYVAMIKASFLDEGYRFPLKNLVDKNEAIEHTIILLRELNRTRRVKLVKFLFESNLINSENPAIPLAQADLSEVNLSGADLEGVNLRGVNLSRASLAEIKLKSADLGGAYLISTDLNDANLKEANLGEVSLMNANLTGADLGGAILGGADLLEADLMEANLEGADLREANLTDAKVTDEQLRQANHLDNAILPDGTRYRENKEKDQE